MGSIDETVASMLFQVLSKHTTSRNCSFLIWEGYSDLLPEVRGAPSVTASLDRVMRVRHGDLDLALQPVDSPPNRLAMNWLPDDAAWFVGNDIYARSVFVGGSLSAVGAILAEPTLEAYPVRRSQRLVVEDF